VIKLKDLYPNQASFLMEKKELGSAYIEKIRLLTQRNNHTTARLELAKQMKNKMFIDIYEGMIKIQDAYGSFPMDLGKFRQKMDNQLFKAAKQYFSNYDIIKGVF
tara:strand:+ start:210 stop:524 length:315 start_codon:yes stop_codon:yes gene_type:complete